MKFAIIGNNYQSKKSSTAERLIHLLHQHEAQICMDREFYLFLTKEQRFNLPDIELFDGTDFTADIIVSLGGDGTFLKAASRAVKKVRHQYWSFGIFGRCSSRRNGGYDRRDLCQPL